MSRLSAEEINEIIHRRALGQSIRGIARSMYRSRRRQPRFSRARWPLDSKVRRTRDFPGDAVAEGAWLMTTKRPSAGSSNGIPTSPSYACWKSYGPWVTRVDTRLCVNM